MARSWPAEASLRRDPEGGGQVVTLGGRLVLDDASRIMERLGQGAGATTVVLEEGCQIDPSVVALLVAWCRGDGQRHVRAESPRLEELVTLLENSLAATAGDEAPSVRRPWLERLGMRVFDAGTNVLDFLGRLLAAVGQAAVRPLRVRWRAVPALVERIGADGVGIVVLINVLMGVVMGFQGVVQLQRFGATEYVAHLVGIAVTRELGPVMTAIVVTGRSGAAISAELATMKVSEEIDALRTLGFDPMRFLVLPRTLALIVALPVLTLIGNAAAVLGSMVVAMTTLGTTALSYVVII